MADSDHTNTPTSKDQGPYHPPTEIATEEFERPRRWPIVWLFVLGLGLLLGLAVIWLLAPASSVRQRPTTQDNVLQHVQDFGDIRRGSLEDEYQ